MHARDPERGQNRPEFSLVFPTFNPGPNLGHIWREVVRFLKQGQTNWEVLFVCDGCTDGTPRALEKLAATEPFPIRVLSYFPNRGKGYAVRQGLQSARGQWRLFTDVDLAYRFEDIVQVADTLRSGADVAIASRLHPESRLVLHPWLQGYAYRRHLQSQVFSTIVRWLLPLTQRDTQAGLKGISARAAQMVLPHLKCDGFEFDCELLTACVRFGLGITEVPVWVRYEDTVSTTSLGAMGKMLRNICKIRRTWQRGVWPGSGETSPTQQQSKDRKAA